MVSSGMESWLLWRSILHCINYAGHFRSMNGNQLFGRLLLWGVAAVKLAKMLTVCFLWESHWCVLSMWQYCYTFINRSAWFTFTIFYNVSWCCPMVMCIALDAITCVISVYVSKYGLTSLGTLPFYLNILMRELKLQSLNQEHVIFCWVSGHLATVLKEFNTIFSCFFILAVNVSIFPYVATDILTYVHLLWHLPSL